MGSMRRGIAESIDADVRQALQAYSAEYVQRAHRGEVGDVSGADAARDAMALQDTLHGRAPSVPAVAPRRETVKVAPRPASAKPAKTQRSPGAIEPTLRRSSAPARKVPTRSAPVPATPPRETPPRRTLASRQQSSATSSIRATVPAPAQQKALTPSRPSPPADALPGTAGLPALLRRPPKTVLAEARSKNAVERQRLISAARAALSTVHKGAFPTAVARPAGDRAHQVIKGLERLQMAPPPQKSTSSGSTKRRRKKSSATRGTSLFRASLSAKVRRELEKADQLAADEAKKQSTRAMEGLPLAPRDYLLRGYGVPVSGGLPSLGRRS